MKWYLFLIFGVCCISTSAIFITLAGAEPSTAAFYRNLFAALIWLGLYRFSTPFKKCYPKSDPGFTVKLKWLQSFAEKGGLVFILGGLGLMFALDLWAWHRCIGLVGAGPATLLGNIQVVFIALLSRVVFGEVLKSYYWFGSGLALLGIGLLTLTHGVGHDVFFGVVLGLFTAFTYAIFLIFLKLLGRYEIASAQILFWVAVSTLVFIAVPFFWEQHVLIPDLQTLSWLFLHAFVSSVLGWWLIVKALQYLPVTRTATILLLQPLLTSLWGHLFLQQYLDMVQLIGIIVALAGIRLANWQKVEECA
jgi:drug/metabolite transporter (DMT)-like permease